MTQAFRILALDGGGSLGVYTLGVLLEVEKMLGRPLSDVFDLVYGTSTGSIIAALVALGRDAESIRELYFDMAPDIMSKKMPSSKSVALEKHAAEIFGNDTFDAFKLDIGIVTTHLEYNRPMVFKRMASQAHGSLGSFEPGFGATIADAVVASCSAYPVFKSKKFGTKEYGDRVLVDGGFAANNPSLLALADALGPLEVPRHAVKLLSIGTGNYPEKFRVTSTLLHSLSTVKTLLKVSSNTVDTMRQLFFGDVYTLRLDDSFTDRNYRTDFVESDVEVLQAIYQLGRKTFSAREREIRAYFN